MQSQRHRTRLQWEAPLRDKRPNSRCALHSAVAQFRCFSGTILPLTVGRAASIKLLDETLPQTKIIGLLTQRDETKEDPEPQDLYSIGTAAIVLKLIRQSDDHHHCGARSPPLCLAQDYRHRSISAGRSRAAQFQDAAPPRMGSDFPGCAIRLQSFSS